MTSKCIHIKVQNSISLFLNGLYFVSSVFEEAKQNDHWKKLEFGIGFVDYSMYEFLQSLIQVTSGYLNVDQMQSTKVSTLESIRMSIDSVLGNGVRISCVLLARVNLDQQRWPFFAVVILSSGLSYSFLQLDVVLYQVFLTKKKIQLVQSSAIECNTAQIVKDC